MVKCTKMTRTNLEFLNSIAKLLYDARKILFHQYNRCIQYHKDNIKDQDSKFVFQMKLKVEFNDDVYDEWNDITLSCLSDWYDQEELIMNKDVLKTYAKGKYLNYYKKIILTPTLCYLSEKYAENNILNQTDSVIHTINTSTNEFT